MQSNCTLSKFSTAEGIITWKDRVMQKKGFPAKIGKEAPFLPP
jgi:hypothetical protein